MRAKTIHNIGFIHAQRGEWNEALDNYNQSLSELRSVGDGLGELSVLLGIAKAQARTGQLEEARSNAEHALSIIESTRARIISQQLRTSFFASVYDFYETYIDVLMQLDGLNPHSGFADLSFFASERLRARSLLDTLAETKADIHEGVEASLLERDRQVTDQLNQRSEDLVRLLAGNPSDERVTKLRTEIELLSLQHQDVDERIRATSPRYAALTQPVPLKLADVQAQLDPDTTLLEYFLGEDRSFLWAVTANSMHSIVLPKRRDVEAAARAFYGAVSARGLHPERETAVQRVARISRADAELPVSAQALSDMILVPTSAFPPGKRLVVVADGALQYVPFAALADPRSPTTYVPLVIEHEIAMLPSASVLSVLRREATARAAATRRLAVLADPVFDRMDARIVPLGHSVPAPAAGGDLNVSVSDRILQRSVGAVRGAAVRTGLPRLRYTRSEADAIAALLPRSDVLKALDFDASLQTAMSVKLADYRIVHFATHGLLNSDHPEFSGLVLSLFDRNGGTTPGFLKLQDIYNLRLAADLVVLSACQTGLGRDVKGEGMVSLTRGFMYAGSPRVVVSLWLVDDRGAATFMERFYRAMLGTGAARPAAALRLAQLDMIQSHRWPPYYWAPFEIQGEWR